MLKAVLVSQPSSAAAATLLSSAEATRIALCPTRSQTEVEGLSDTPSSVDDDVSGSCSGSRSNVDASSDQSVLAELERRACNADPNYGTLWLFCKKHQFDTALQVMRSARIAIQNEIVKHRKKYGVVLLQEDEREREEGAAPASPASASKRGFRAIEVAKALNEACGVTAADRAVFSMGIQLSASDIYVGRARRLVFT